MSNAEIYFNIQHSLFNIKSLSLMILPDRVLSLNIV